MDPIVVERRKQRAHLFPIGGWIERSVEPVVRIFAPASGVTAPVRPCEKPFPLRNPVLPLPVVTVSVRPDQCPSARNDAVLPLPDIFVSVSPNVTAVPFL